MAWADLVAEVRRRSRFLGEALSPHGPGRARAPLAHGRRWPSPTRCSPSGCRRRRRWWKRCWPGASGQPRPAPRHRGGRRRGRAAAPAPDAHRGRPQGRPAAVVPGQGSGPRHGRRCVRFGDRGLACPRIPRSPTLPGSWPDYPIAWQIFSSSFSLASRCRAGCSNFRPSSPAGPSRPRPAAAWCGSRPTAGAPCGPSSSIRSSSREHDAEFLGDLVTGRGGRGAAPRGRSAAGRDAEGSHAAVRRRLTVSAIDELITELARLPGIGRKTAQRLTFHLLQQPPEQAGRLASALVAVSERVRPCDGVRQPHRGPAVRHLPRPAARPGAALRGGGGVDGGGGRPLDRFPGPLSRARRPALARSTASGPSRCGSIISCTGCGTGGVREVILATNPSMEGEVTATYIQQLLAGAGRARHPAGARAADGRRPRVRRRRHAGARAGGRGRSVS